MSKNDAKTTVEQIRQLEGGYCNPRKFNEAVELREDLRRGGFSDDEIERMLRDDE